VQVDKQISCNDGTDWEDAGFGDSAANGCIADVGASSILARYFVRNNGNLPATCTLTDSNQTILLDPGITGINLPVGATDQSVGEPLDPGVCETAHAGGEPNTASLSCTCNAGAAGQVPDSDTDSATFACCGVQIDKQISCGGDPFVDTGFADNTTGSCSAIDGESVTAQYFLQNISTTGVSLSCTILDAGGGQTIVDLDAGEVGTPPAPGGTSSAITGWTETCGQVDIEAHEPNTATANCACSAEGLVDRSGGDSDADTAAATCDTPEFNISKACIPSETTPGQFTADITINNTGDVALTCDVSDQTFAGACPPAGTGTNLFTEDDVLVTAASTEHSTFDFTPTETVCNQATVTCTPAGGSALPSQNAEATCPVAGGGCFTRTPGFWQNHRVATEAVLPVRSCGVDLTKATADPEGSTVEDMCVNANEAKFGTSPPTSPQQVQLIRQCAAAALNLAVSAEAELSCSTATIGGSISFGDIEERFAECCGDTGVCNDNSSPSDINDSGCIGYLDAFNNANFNDGDSEPTIADIAGSDWNSTEPEQCRIAGGNRDLNDGGRDYGPAK
jgi:hypothetical protein